MPSLVYVTEEFVLCFIGRRDRWVDSEELIFLLDQTVYCLFLDQRVVFFLEIKSVFIVKNENQELHIVHDKADIWACIDKAYIIHILSVWWTLIFLHDSSSQI